MDLDFERRIDERAHVLLGSESRERERDKLSEAVISRILGNALKFCEKVEPILGSPSVSGGTTATPNIVLMLFWEVVHKRRLGGIYVSFNIDKSITLEWSESKASSHSQSISFDDLLSFDFVATLNRIKNKVVK